MPTINIEMNNTRGCSIASSPNLSRELSVFSKALSMKYAERIQTQSNFNIWTEQIDNENFQPTSQNLELFAILYEANQSTNSQLWDSSFCSIFLFGLNKYLEGDLKNIMSVT